MGERLKLLLTGGAGFIGGNFVHKYLTDEMGDILVLDKLTYAGHLATLAPWQSNSHYRFVEGDIGDSALVGELLDQFQPTIVVNFAAESHVDRSIDSARDFIQTNLVGTYELLDQTLHYWQKLGHREQANFRFHHVSTDEVYGTLGPTGLFREDTPFAPNSPYAASKAGSDHLVRAYHHTYGLPTTISNCSNNYGPYQYPEKLIPLVLMNALEGRPIPVYGDGLNIRDWLYVGDHCDAILSVIAAGRVGETYNVGGDSERTNLDLLTALFVALRENAEQIEAETNFDPNRDYESLITFVSDRPGHDRRYAVDTGKIRRELGWAPSQSLAQGLSSTVSWYVSNLDWCETVLKEYDRSRLGTV